MQPPYISFSVDYNETHKGDNSWPSYLSQQAGQSVLLLEGTMDYLFYKLHSDGIGVLVAYTTTYRQGHTYADRYTVTTNLVFE